MKTALALLAMLLPMSAAQAQPYEVTMRSGIEYVEHDGVKLAGDLYLPRGRDKSPVIVAAHGGGWQVGNRASYQHWGPFSPGMASACSPSTTASPSPARRAIRPPSMT